MSYNESYADKNLSDYAYGNGVDKGAATKYGDVFVEHTSQDLEAACNGVQCYVACSCKNNGPDDENGWFSTIAEAQHGNPNAQVYTVTSDIHYSRDSVSTSSLNDLTIATTSTTALANQTPISRASTLSSLTIDAPTLKTASTSGTKATCYKKVPCADGYFATEPTSDQRAAIEFDEDTSTGVTCYKPTGCKTSDNYQDYYVSDYYEEYEGKICYYYPIPNSLDIMFYDLNGGASMDCGLYTVNYEVYNSSEGNTVSQWWDLSESLTFDAYYYSGSQYYSMIDEPVTPADIRLTVDYNENYSPIYTITQYNVSVNRIYLDGKYYKSGDTINLTVTDDVNGYTFTNQPLTLHISYDQGCMNTCPSGYYDTLTSCQSALIAGHQCELQSNNCYKVVETPCPDGYYNTEDKCRTSITDQGGYYGMHGTCEYDSSSQCYKLYMCPINEGEYILSQPPTDVYNYTTESTTPSGKTCYKATSCKSGYTTDDTGFNCSGFPGLRCCQELPYYLNLYISGTNNLGFYEYTTTYTVTTESGQGNSSWTVSDLANASVDLSCNGSYPPTQFKGLTFRQNASASANTKTITGYGCSGLPELEAVAINNYTISDGEEYTMNVAGQGASNLHVKINYSAYDPCGQNPGYYARKADCEATITNPNTQVCQTTNASNYRCYEVVKGCNSNNGYYTLESDCTSSLAGSYTTTCVYKDGCYVRATCPSGYYSVDPDDYRSYINIESSNNTSPSGGTCYRGTSCNQGLTPNYGSTENYYLNYIYPGMNYYCSGEYKGGGSCPTDIWFMVIKHSDDDTPHYQLAYNMTKNGTICLTNQSSPNSYCNLSNNMWYTASVNVYVGYNYTINNANWHLTDDPNGSYDGVGYDVGEITKVNYITMNNGNKYYDGDTINLDVVDVADDCEMTLHLGLYDSSDFQN